MFAAAQDNGPIIVAIITATSLIIVALIGVWAAHRKIATQVTAIERGINHVAVPYDGEGEVTLGQIVVEGFAQNQRDHATAFRAITEQGVTLSDLGGRVNTLETKERT